jgi:site-specific DNA-methyltransferase (adenine-specific)
MSARAEQGRFDGLVPPTASDAGLNAPSDTMLTGIPSTTTRATSPCCAGDATCSSMEGLTSSESWRERTNRELYERGGIRPYYSDDSCIVLLGDCRELLPLIEPVDLVLTDPPYGIGVTNMTLGNGMRKVFRGSEWDAEPADVSPLLALESDAVIWGGNYFGLPPSRCWLVWDKGTGSNDFADCELAWTNRDAVVKKYFRSWVGANAKERSEADRYHPTQKPVELMRWCIEFYPLAQTILDPFMGSGTTLRAAKDLGRKAIGIEIEEKYCYIAAKRLQQSVLPLEIPA